MSELAKIRRSRGFSQRGLAEAANVSPSSVYEIETGRRKANPSTLRKLADALGVEVMDLLEEEERPKVTAPPEPEITEQEKRLSEMDYGAFMEHINSLPLEAVERLPEQLSEDFSLARRSYILHAGEFKRSARELERMESSKA